MATETVAGSLSVQAIPDPQYGEIVDTYGNEFKVPDFTIKQIRDAIPRHCFERSALRGFAYITRDILLLASTFYIFHNYATVEYVRSSRFRFCLWTFHGFLQGLFAIGIWIIAHDCGHQAFSLSKPLDDAMGWMLHSTFFVFCFSWKISHGKHHKNSGYMDRDMAFLPKIREVYASRVRRKVHELTELTEEAPLVTAGILLGRQLIGWFLYLLQNRIEHNNHQRQSEGRGVGKYNGLAGGVNHFNPSSSLFEAKDAKYILLSDLGLGLMAFLLYEIAQIFGWYSILTRYIVPYLWVYHWLVAITYLQHTDPSVLHYGAKSWNFTRGAAATIDRDFGFIGRSLFYGIIETHVLHHYVSIIPFYHAEEATNAIKSVMGRHYLSNIRDGPVGFLKSL